MITDDCILETTRRRLLAEGLPLVSYWYQYPKDSFSPYFIYVYRTERGLRHISYTQDPSKIWLMPKEVARSMLWDIEFGGMGRKELREYYKGETK